VAQARLGYIQGQALPKSRGRYGQKEKRLKELIRQRGLKMAGEPVFARYNPPFMPWFLRRNEVLIPVER
jgi:hypothetical protein